MWTPSSPLSRKFRKIRDDFDDDGQLDSSSSRIFRNFRKIRDDFDDDGQLDSIAPAARSNPTARRRRNHLEFFGIFMTKVTGTETVHTLDGTRVIDCCQPNLAIYNGSLSLYVSIPKNLVL